HQDADAVIASINQQGLHSWSLGEIISRPPGAPQTIVI
ncbi:MAG: hypothetical protein RIR08_1239, partial [Pseudomonadota bacterium]